MNTREASLKSLIKILEKNDSYDLVMSSYSEQLKYPTELKKILSATIKNLSLIDFFIQKVIQKKLSKFSLKTRNILRLAICEMLILKEPEYAIINSYVELAKSEDKKAKNFINWALREYTRSRKNISLKELDFTERVRIGYSQPLWLVEKWIKEFGEANTIKLCAFYNKPPNLVLRSNLINISHNKLKELFDINNIKYSQSSIDDCLILEHQGSVKQIPGYNEGYWTAQGESSALVSHVLDPKGGEEILDVCAAPGGKTTHIASLTNNKAQITSLDVNGKRLEKISENIKRLGIKNVKLIEADASKVAFGKEFDKVLIDAPCSNTGVLGKRVDARWKRKQSDIQQLCNLQYQILNNISQYVKQGGEVVYSTCSIEKEENVDLIHKFLKNNNNYNLLEMIKIYPFENNFDGFFIAKLVRVE